MECHGPASWHTCGTGFGRTTATLRPLADLSDRLTRIARTRGMLFGQGIDVYLSNNKALVQGIVHSPGDSALLANVLALEPEVRQIDNRLVPEGSGGLSSNSESR